MSLPLVNTPSDLEILEALYGPLLRINPEMKPKMGTGKQVGFDQFLSIYSCDPLYAPIGFASKGMYNAHQSLTRLTSLYRNVGTGTEAVVKLLIERCLGIPPELHKWSYHYEFHGSPRTRHLDGAIRFAEIKDPKLRRRLRDWAQKVRPEADLDGIVLEVREGYKSSDAKRSNGDKDAVIAAGRDKLLPVMLVMSDQIAADAVVTYTKHGWHIEAGAGAYAFCKKAFGVDLVEVMGRNPRFMNRVRRHVKKLI